MRPTCPRCLRPVSFCACASFAPAYARTRVVLLQHPREARLAICSAWLTRIALQNVELHRGVRFERHPRVSALAAAQGTMLLYPGEEAIAPEALADRPPATLVVLDGTWLQAERMLRDNPALAALPRLGLRGGGPSGYGDLRREPRPECLSTIEAVARALGALEDDPGRFEPMCTAFRSLVEKQLACARGAGKSPRHRPLRPRDGER